MRIVYKKLVDGTEALVCTNDDGTNPTVIEGALPSRSIVQRVPIFIELSCDDRSDVVDAARTALQKIGKVLKEQLGDK